MGVYSVQHTTGAGISHSRPRVTSPIKIGGIVPARTHGMSKTPTYQSWYCMMRRCLCKTASDYPRYGARGITVCKRWRFFLAFLADMGPRPLGHTIDRFPDQNGNYQPGNCRWATPAQQQANRCVNRMLSWRGRTMQIRDWERKMGLGKGSLYARINHGWKLKDALTTPTGSLPRGRCTPTVHSLHVRWHLKRSITNPSCPLCARKAS